MQHQGKVRACSRWKYFLKKGELNSGPALLQPKQASVTWNAFQGHFQVKGVLEQSDYPRTDWLLSASIKIKKTYAGYNDPQVVFLPSHSMAFPASLSLSCQSVTQVHKTPLLAMSLFLSTPSHPQCPTPPKLLKNSTILTKGSKQGEQRKRDQYLSYGGGRRGRKEPTAILSTMTIMSCLLFGGKGTGQYVGK